MTGAARTEAHDTRGRYVIIGGQGSCTSGVAEPGHVDYPVFRAAHATPVPSVSLPGGRARRNACLRHHLDIDIDPLRTGNAFLAEARLAVAQRMGPRAELHLQLFAGSTPCNARATGAWQ
jgi:hypothetical protein